MEEKIKQETEKGIVRELQFQLECQQCKAEVT